MCSIFARDKIGGPCVVIVVVVVVVVVVPPVCACLFPFRPFVPFVPVPPVCSGSARYHIIHTFLTTGQGNLEVTENPGFFYDPPTFLKKYGTYGHIPGARHNDCSWC